MKRPALMVSRNRQGYKVLYPELSAKAQKKADAVNHPSHYIGHPSGVECIEIVEHMNFCRGNAIKYIWRAGEKGSEIQDLEKARWYIDREIARIESSTST